MSKQIWSLDTEDDSKGNVYLLTFDTGEFHTFRKPKAAVKWLGKQTCAADIWCTNLGYDLANLFQGSFYFLEITYIKGRIISAKIRGTKVVFKDTLNHWKISVQEMGKRIGLEKLEANGNYDDVEYNQRDARITRTFVLTMKAKYEEFGAELKSTIGSTALNLFHSRFHPKPEHSAFSDQHISWMLDGYFGGRVEIFHTEPVTGPIYYYDFNSLYPSTMVGRDFPKLDRFGFTKNFNESAEGMVEALVQVPKEMEIPYLATRSDHGLIFPTGRFRGRWTHFEMRQAQKFGVKIEKVYRALEFLGTTRPFDEFMTTLYKQRLEAKAIGDELMSDSAKLIMNNLYGKFAQGNEITKLVPYVKSELQQGDQILQDMVLRNQVKDYPKHTNVIWSAYVTAYGRDKLHTAMMDVLKAGGQMLYCDTDSVIFRGKTPFTDSKELGELKLENIFDYAHFKLPKLYRLDKDGKTTARAKGVPRKSAVDFFEKGFAEFQRPNKLRESLRRKLVPNEWHLTRKEMRREYDKRIRYPDGTTSPIHLG